MTRPIEVDPRTETVTPAPTAALTFSWASENAHHLAVFADAGCELEIADGGADRLQVRVTGSRRQVRTALTELRQIAAMAWLQRRVDAAMATA